MTITDMQIPVIGITSDDIIRKTVDNVYDTVDGVIPNTEVVILVDTLSGSSILTAITDPGTYLITYYVSDKSDNTSTYDKHLTYIGSKIMDSGETYIVPTNIISVDIEYVSGTGTTATVVLSGVSFTIACISGITNEEFVWDFGGMGEYNFGSGNTGSINIMVLGTMFTITFTGRGSLFFTIANNGRPSEYMSVLPYSLSFAYESGVSHLVDIASNMTWNIYSTVSWLEFSTLSGTGDQTIIITTTSENLTDIPNITGVTFSYSGYTLGYSVIQERRPDYINVTPTALTFTYGYGSINMFDIDSNVSWNISDSVTWLTLDSYSGSGSTTMVCTINDENLTGVDRTGTTYVYGNGETYEILMTQSQRPPYFELSTTAITFTSELSDFNTFNMMTNVDWLISDSISWLVPDIYSGTGDSTITMTVTEANTTGFARVGVTSISANDHIYDIVMTQEPAP